MLTDIENRKDIEILVSTFYNKIKTDAEIGYFFTDIANVNWDIHIPKLCDFWEGILFQSTKYMGNPMTSHLKLNQISNLKKEHFEYWIKLFIATVDELFEGKNATIAKERAKIIAMNINSKINT